MKDIKIDKLMTSEKQMMTDLYFMTGTTDELSVTYDPSTKELFLTFRDKKFEMTTKYDGYGVMCDGCEIGVFKLGRAIINADVLKDDIIHISNDGSWIEFNK